MAIKDWGIQLHQSFQTVLRDYSIRQIVAAGLVVVGALFLYWRLRTRLRGVARWHADLCPKCDSGLVRIHRTWLDRALNIILLPNLRRYRCINPECGWMGLRDHH